MIREEEDEEGYSGSGGEMTLGGSQDALTHGEGEGNKHDDCAIEPKPHTPNSNSKHESTYTEDEYTTEIQLGWKGHWFFICLAAWWCSNTIIVSTATSVIWPAQIEAIVNDPDKQDLYNGFIPSFGAFVSLVITPISGALSDHSTHKLGRRKVFILSGSIIGSAFFLCMPILNVNTGFGSIWILMFLIMGLQFGQQWAGGPYAGLMPDLVPKRFYGLASGWLGLAIAFGNLVGALGAGFIGSRKDNFWGQYLYCFGLFVPLALLTIIFIKEIPRPPPREPFSLRKLVREFYLDPKLYRDFYWVVVTRFLFDMGVYSIVPFFQYYYKDVIKSDHPVLMSSLTVGVIVLTSIPATIVAGKLSDRLGRKSMVWGSTLLMATGCTVLVIGCYHPSIILSLLMAAMIGVGYGAYQAVDWALALDVLPPGANIAKDMGIWHLAFVLPQVISPVITGAVLQEIKKSTVQGAYATVFGITTLWFLSASVFVYPVRNVTHAQPTHNKLITGE